MPSLCPHMLLWFFSCTFKIHWPFFDCFILSFCGLPRWLSGKESACQCLPMQETQEKWVPSLGQKIPWRRKWQPTPVFLPGVSHGQRSLAGHKEQDVFETWLSTFSIYFSQVSSSSDLRLVLVHIVFLSE